MSSIPSIKCEYEYDSIVNTVVDKYQKRAFVGQLKYGTTLDRKDVSLSEWLNHLQEELMDATLYIEKLKTCLSEKNIEKQFEKQSEKQV